MPRENRKRGKKHKPKAAEQPTLYEEPPQELEFPAGPSWIVSASGEESEYDPEAPFGYVDTDVKAYFRTVDIQIRDWQESRAHIPDGDAAVDPNAEKRMFFVAALSEMRGKEKQLATDPDCSIILERMAYSMDDFVRRVFLDSLSGSYDTLVKHRFASHVCQTIFTVASETITREARGNVAPAPEASEGELRTATDLILDICKELLPSLGSLIMNPFASHVIRALLGLLCPSSNSISFDETTQGALRSKKSAHWKSRQGPLVSVFDDKKGKGKEVTARQTSPDFRAMSRKFVESIRNELGDNEIRALAADKVASPCLLMLLNVEAELEMADEHGSLMDRITVGAVSASLAQDTVSVDPSDYLGTLFRDPTSSHLLETVLSKASDKPFALIWNAYLRGKLPRLAVHPVGNFVVAKALERADASQLATAYEELQEVWEKMIVTSRTGVLRAAVDRSVALRTSEANAVEAAFSALNLVSDEDKTYLVPCMFSLKPLPVFKSARDPQSSAESIHEKKGKKDHDPSSQPSIQGSLLLQSLLKLPPPHNQLVINSLAALDSSELLKFAHNATSSRVLDVLLDSATVPIKAKRTFVQSFIGSYHILVDDRIGSRVGDRCFAFADTYLKEKIARSLIPQEQTLAGSYYGKFFSRNLNLYLLKRRPDEWKTYQSKRKADTNATITASDASNIPPTAEDSSESKKKRKREARAKDEIDELFDSAHDRKKPKSNKAAVDSPAAAKVAKEASSDNPVDKELKDVLKAIHAAPKTDFKVKGRAKHRD
ncbi:armadillo-type protein [Lentinula aciculospora]|uniref:Nucleolar protein 9 n=1 Tax=Lentinula aciculospora TaxID=153920 RepID=A0A9W9A2W9_9AGAR|nr:armadillo-type protein [Lentinula aciculospora]